MAAFPPKAHMVQRVSENGKTTSVDPSNLVVAGDSVGGNMAAAICRWQEPRPLGGWHQGGGVAAAESEFECALGAVASLRERGVSVENDLVWRGLTAAGAVE